MEAVMQYTIRPYDTIWMLAQVFNTTVESIMDLNPGINPTNLQIGHVISIAPGYRYYPTRPEGRPVELMPREQRPTAPMPRGTMPSEQRPTAPMPSGTMPSEQRPIGPTPSGTMPGGTMPGGTMPSSPRPTAPMPSGTMPSEQRPTGPTPSGTMPSGTMPGSPRPTSPTPTSPTPSGTMPSEQRPTAPMPSGPRPTAPMPNGTMPSSPRPTGSTPSGGMAPGGSINGSQMNTPRPMGPMPYDNMRDGMNDYMNDDMDYMGFMDTYNYFRMLWSQHYFWTMYVIEAIIFDLPTLEAGTERLLRNPVDFANALIPYFGEEAATEFGDLFTDHLMIAGEVVQAAKAGDNNAYNNAQERWHDNADQIAAFLGNLNPNWSEDDWNAMLYDHLDLLTTAVGDLLQENYTQAIGIYDDIELQIMDMSDMFIEGILSEGME